MKPTNSKTARNHVLPLPMREQGSCEENVGFDEILLSPNRLSRLLYNNDLVLPHLNIGQQGELTEEENNLGKIKRVSPALDQENILRSNSDLEVGEEQDEGRKLPPAKLQKVRSEDLSWLDTIIYDTAPTTTTTPTVKQQRGNQYVRSDKDSM